MRFHILEKIERADTPLAHLFNAYLNGLSTLDFCCTPRQSMHECRLSFAAEARGEVLPLPPTGQARRFYELAALGNAIHNLYWCIGQAHELLVEFYSSHSGDLLAYAQTNRRQTLLDCGGGEDADWHHNGHGNPDAGEGWEVTDTTDPARLTEYSLHRELAQYFANDDEQSERIGTSGSADFDRFTVCVEHQTDFAPRKLFAAMGWGSFNTYRINEAGEMEPVSLADEIEQELNNDLAAGRVVTAFNAVLNAGQHLAKLHATMTPDDLCGYALLHEGLSNVLAVHLEAYPPF